MYRKLSTYSMAGIVDPHVWVSVRVNIIISDRDDVAFQKFF